MNEQRPGKDMAETNFQDTGTMIEREKEYHDKLLEDNEEETENQDANNESCESKNIDHEPVNENSDQQIENKSGDAEECNANETKDNQTNDANDDECGDKPNEDPNNEDNTEESDVEYDPDILAAMEASLLEAESDDDDDPDENDNDNIEDKGEKDKQTLMRFCNETELDSNDEKSENEEYDEEENDGEVDGNNHEVEGNENEDEDELTLEGEPETGETPFDMDVEEYEENPLDDENCEGYDPLDEDGIGVDETTNGFLDQINSGYSAEVHNFPETKRGPRGPYKKKRSLNVSDAEDFDPLKENSKSLKKSRLPRGAEVYFKCNLCCFPFDTLGELKVHKYSDHEDQDKPSYLDLAEAAVAKLNKKSGVSKATILMEIMSDPSVTDHIEKARQFLNKAVKAGVQRGRLRQGQAGKKGSQSYWIVSKAQRREVLVKYNKNKKSVEFNDVDDFSNVKVPVSKPSARKVTARSYATVSITPKNVTPPDPKNFGRGKRASKPSPRNFGEITLESSSSEDEISIIAEKITPKTKLKLMHNQKRLPSSMVKIGNAKNVKRVTANFGKKIIQPQIKKPEPVPPPKEVDPFEDDEDLTCRICLNAFWYKPQILEHLKTVHSIQDPEAFLKEKKTSI